MKSSTLPINLRSEKEQIEYIKADNHNILDIDRPSMAVQMAAVSIRPFNIILIKNPCKEAILYALKNSPQLLPVSNFQNKFKGQHVVIEEYKPEILEFILKSLSKGYSDDATKSLNFLLTNNIKSIRN